MRNDEVLVKGWILDLVIRNGQANRGGVVGLRAHFLWLVHICPYARRLAGRNYAGT